MINNSIIKCLSTDDLIVIHDRFSKNLPSPSCYGISYRICPFHDHMASGSCLIYNTGKVKGVKIRLLLERIKKELEERDGSYISTYC